MRFATRTFLWVFIPFVAMMGFNFWLIRMSVTSAVRDGLRETVLQNQKQLAAERARSDQQIARILGVVAENPSLKAGLQLLIDEHHAPAEARSTVEDQLSEICDSLGFAFLMVLDPGGKPLAGIQRSPTGFAPMNLDQGTPPLKGLYTVGKQVFHVTSVPVKSGAEEIGVLAVGEEFTLASLTTPAALLRGGQVIGVSGVDIGATRLQALLENCPGQAECEVVIGRHTYLSLPLTGDLASSLFESDRPDSNRGEAQAAQIQVRSLQDVDAAASPVLASLGRIFLTGTGLSVLAAVGIAGLSSGSIVRPLAVLVHSLHASTKTGAIQELPAPTGGTIELRELTDGFNHAAAAIRQGRERLVAAYVEFTGSLAQALDARDPYTAGHSQRVSEYAVAIGRAMNLPLEALETIRVGALLHDIGKIGVPDAVLQKPGKLTAEEEAMIREHPSIGRRILEGVHGLEQYLPVIELHHENWDGAGYPRGLKADATPLAARIVKVADAYDAMTTDRPYRQGISHQQAVAIIEKIAGTQTDPEVVRAFCSVRGVGKIPGSLHQTAPAEVANDGLANLANAVASEPLKHTVDPIGQTEKNTEHPSLRGAA